MVEPKDELASIRALEEVYRRRYRRFLRVAIAIVGSADAATDVVQEAFASALRHRHEFRGEGTLDAWVWRTVLNEARELSRTRRRHQSVEPPERPAPADGAPDDWPELRAAVAGLPTRQRDVLFLRHY